MLDSHQTQDSQQVRNMYESNEVKAGEIISGGFLHYGYFDSSNINASLAEGSERFTRIMIEKTPIREGQRFCDIGCGVGAPAIMLARERKCLVDGITISKHQQEQASMKAEAEGVSDRVRFVVADALNMPFDDGTYDGGWFFESIFHMGHRAALKEAHRVLKPGSILLLADFVTVNTTGEGFARFAKEVVRSSYLSKEEYPGVLNETGFELIDLTDITKEVVVPFPSKFKAAFEAHKEQVVNLVNDDAINHWLEVHEIISSNLGYVMMSARRL